MTIVDVNFEIVICFHDLRRLRAFVCELFPITRINQDFLLAIKTNKIF